MKAIIPLSFAGLAFVPMTLRDLWHAAIPGRALAKSDVPGDIHPSETDDGAARHS